jgi:hypothetical protein
MMNRNALKYIAVAAMFSDHIALAFIGTDNPVGIIMRLIGRMTAPIMCYFIVEGFMHTHSKKQYGKRLLVFALISQIPFSYLLTGRLLSDRLNMMFTLFFCFMILVCLEKIDNRFLRLVSCLAIFILCTNSDWGMVAPLWVIVFAAFRNDKKKMNIFYLIVCIFWVARSISMNMADAGVWYSTLWQAGTILALPILNAYNGKAGKASRFSKWFFYWIYPLHIMIIAVIYRGVLSH